MPLAGPPAHIKAQQQSIPAAALCFCLVVSTQHGGQKSVGGLPLGPTPTQRPPRGQLHATSSDGHPGCENVAFDLKTVLHARLLCLSALNDHLHEAAMIRRLVFSRPHAHLLDSRRIKHELFEMCADHKLAAAFTVY